jgi:hypothetical protein
MAERIRICIVRTEILHACTVIALHAFDGSVDRIAIDFQSLRDRTKENIFGAHGDDLNNQILPAHDKNENERSKQIWPLAAALANALPNARSAPWRRGPDAKTRQQLWKKLAAIPSARWLRVRGVP